MEPPGDVDPPCSSEMTSDIVSRTEIKKTSLRVLALLFLNGTVWLGGSVLFMYLEAPTEAVHKCGVRRVRRDFLEVLWLEAQTLDEPDWKSLARRKLEHFEEEIHTAVEAGQSTYSGQNVWTPSNALLYTFTISSTIGYGGLTPSSPWVRLTSILYAGLACPLFALLLSQLTSLIQLLAQTVVQFRKEETGTYFKSVVVLLIVHSVTGSFMLSFLYNWSLQDSLYFLGATFTTIGFGDIVPEDSLVFLVLAGYILTGLSLFSIYQDIVTNYLSGILELWLDRSTEGQKQHVD